MIKCDPRAKARCPFKTLCCGDEKAYFVEGSDCDKFNQEVLSPPPTNADRIRAMSDEELAKILGDKCICPPIGECAKMSGDCEKCWFEWLKQPYKEVPHA